MQTNSTKRLHSESDDASSVTIDERKLRRKAGSDDASSVTIDERKLRRKADSDDASSVTIDERKLRRKADSDDTSSVTINEQELRHKADFPIHIMHQLWFTYTNNPDKFYKHFVYLPVWVMALQPRNSTRIQIVLRLWRSRSESPDLWTSTSESSDRRTSTSESLDVKRVSQILIIHQSWSFGIITNLRLIDQLGVVK